MNIIDGGCMLRLVRAEAIQRATEIAQRRADAEGVAMAIYEARKLAGGGRYHVPVFYVCSAVEGPPPREPGALDPNDFNPPYSGPELLCRLEPSIPIATPPVPGTAPGHA